MAKATRHPMFDGLSGTLGRNYYIRTMRDGRSIICRKPKKRNRQFSEAQLRNQELTRQAAAYARVAALEQPIYAKKAARTRGRKNAFNIAFADWRKPPRIDSIEVREGEIYVQAYDNVQVVSVTISILDEAGQCLEQGEAQGPYAPGWKYTPAQWGRILVEVRDLAGNVTRQEFCPSQAGWSSWTRPAR